MPPDICQNTSDKGGLNHLHVKYYVHNLRVKWMTQLWSDTTRIWSTLHGGGLHRPFW